MWIAETVAVWNRVLYHGIHHSWLQHGTLADFMRKLRNVALIIDASQPYDREIVQGVAAYVRQTGHWSIYLEENPQQKLPDWRGWSGDGVIADLDDRKVAEAVGSLRIPVVGIGGGYGWSDLAARIPCFVSNDEAIGQLAAEHLLDRGFSSMALSLIHI